MSRHPLRALAEADAIAKKRGHVQHYERGPGMICDFTITIPECHTPVKIKRMRYRRCTVQWLERHAAQEIAGLRLFPSSKEISRELWFCSPEYAFRFFRVTDTTLIELGRDGQPLPAKSRSRGRRWRDPSPGRMFRRLRHPGIHPPIHLTRHRVKISPSENGIPGSTSPPGNPLS